MPKFFAKHESHPPEYTLSVSGETYRSADFKGSTDQVALKVLVVLSRAVWVPTQRPLLVAAEWLRVDLKHCLNRRQFCQQEGGGTVRDVEGDIAVWMGEAR